MTNKEKYRQAFSHLQIPEPVHLEDMEMKPERKHTVSLLMKPAAALLTVALIGGTTVYAADLGGIRTTVQGWFQGESRNVEALPTGPGSYEFYDEKTGEYLGGGGGVMYDQNGKEVWLPAEDVLEQQSEVFMIENENTPVLYVRDHVYDLTSAFENKDRIYVKTAVDGQERYFTLKWNRKNQTTSMTAGPDPEGNESRYTELTE